MLCLSIRRIFPSLVVMLGGFCGSSHAVADGKPIVAPQDERALIGNAQLFGRFDVSQAWHGAESQLLKKVCQSHPIVWLWEGHGIEKSLGLRLDELDRVVIYADDLGKLDQIVAIVTTREPFDRDKVVNSLVPNGKPIKGKNGVYVAGDKDGYAVHVRDNRSLAIGRSTSIEAFLARKPGESGALKEAIAASQKPLMTIGIQPKTFLPAIQQAGKDAQPFVPLFHASSWQLTAEGTDQSLSLSFRFTFADDAKAKEAKPGLASVVGPLDDYLAAAVKELPEFFNRETGKYPKAADLKEPMVGTIQAMRAALKEVKIEQDGPVVRAKLSIKTKTPATALLMIANMLPRSEK